ncbi:MAG: carboxypeptidase regulatory-like domain-containing protein [Planctomycetaceae bacterium]
MLALITLSGCPEAALVSVKIKPAIGAGTTSAAAETGGSDAAPAGYGNLLGTITYEGAAPNLRPLVTAADQTTKDPAVCAAVAVPNESLVVNSANNGISNAVVFLDKRPANIKAELAQPSSEPNYFDQKGCRFLPHVLLVRIGQPLFVLSDDPIPHNTQTSPVRNDVFNQTISPNDRKGVALKYSKTEPMPIEVKCSYHTWMKAYHFPVDHPYVAITDKDGKFRIDGLPAGKHSFNVWHERGQLLDRKLQITIEPDKDTEKNLTYGAGKFAAARNPAAPRIAFQRLERGGEISVTQNP